MYTNVHDRVSEDYNEVSKQKTKNIFGGDLGFDVNSDAKGACRATQTARKIKIVNSSCKR